MQVWGLSRSESAGHSRMEVWACTHSGAAGGGALLQGSALTVPESLQGDGNCFASSWTVTPGALWACSVRPPRQAAGCTVLREAQAGSVPVLAYIGGTVSALAVMGSLVLSPDSCQYAVFVPFSFRPSGLNL